MKLAMKTPLVEMDGDEMTRVIWQKIKEILLYPYLDLKTEYYDLGLAHRDETLDAVTEESALATKRLGVAVKCATITPNAQRVEEYGLRQMWKSPNGTIRRILDGTVFRSPILCKGILPYLPAWKEPIVLARHAYGDIYAASDEAMSQGERAYLVVEDGRGREVRRRLLHDFREGAGVAMGMYNCDASIRSFARSCFRYALDRKLPVLFSAKDTIAKTYDGRFKEIFAQVYEQEFAQEMNAAGLWYLYTLIDDAVARIVRSRGGILWACKNYDGDVMSDMVATAYGSLGMMTSVLVSPDPAGVYEYEAAHGTVTRHWYRYRDGEETSTNSVASIFAWTGALKKRGEKDGLADLCAFADRLERATIAVIEAGEMTGDLIPLFHREGISPKKLETVQFLRAVASRLEYASV